MSDATQINEKQAICQVIADTDAADFIDIVNEVRNRFRINVTSVQVEEVIRELKKKQREELTPVSRESRVSLDLNANFPAEETVENPERSSPSAPADSTKSEASTVVPNDDLGKALHFVKSVGGLSYAKRLLGELESIMDT